MFTNVLIWLYCVKLFRLANTRSELTFLIKAANVLKTTGIIFKQKLERKCSDLQMAEDEVIFRSSFVMNVTFGKQFDT